MCTRYDRASSKDDLKAQPVGSYIITAWSNRNAASVHLTTLEPVCEGHIKFVCAATPVREWANMYGTVTHEARLRAPNAAVAQIQIYGEQ